MHDLDERTPPVLPEVPAGGSEIGALMRALDWSSSPAGPIEAWSHALRAALSICLRSPLPTAVFWGNGLLMFYNDACAPFLCRSSSHASPGLPASECWPEMWRTIGPRLRGALAAGDAFSVEDQPIDVDRDGRAVVCYITFSCGPICAEDGSVAGVFCSFADTTARVVNERRLRLLRELAALSGDTESVETLCARVIACLATHADDLPFALLYLLDTGGRRARLAGAAGIVPGSPAGPTSVDLAGVAPDGVAWPLADVAQTARPVLVEDPTAHGVPSRDDGLRHGPALILPLLFSGRGRPMGFLVAATNPRIELDEEYRDFLALVTAQIASAVGNASTRDADRRAPEPDAKVKRISADVFNLRQVLDVLPEAVQIVDVDGRFSLSNRAANVLVGLDVTGALLSVGDSADPHNYWVCHFDGTDYAERDSPLQRALLDGEEVRGHQQLLRQAGTGRHIQLLANAAPLRDPDGAIVGAVKVFQDITGMLQMEEQRDEFLVTVSHDLKNPLTSILGMSQVLQRRVERLALPDSARLTEGLGTIMQSAERMTGQINELLDVARLQMGHPLELNLQSTDLVGLLARLVAEYDQSSERHTVRLETADTLLEILCDAQRIERALINVLGNALKYSPQGGNVAVALRHESHSKGNMVAISITDSGVGIPQRELSRIFERFFRASNVANNISGTGLGLAAVRQVVEQHGGRIALASEEGRGTTVTIRLPYRPQQAS